MSNKEVVMSLWDDMDKKRWNNLYRYFENGAMIKWINTNELFNVDEFIRVNAEYIGDWSISIERLECIEELVISVVKVQLKNAIFSAHAVSFFQFSNGKIHLLDEYWGDDVAPPKDRTDKEIGRPINSSRVKNESRR